MDSEKKDQRQLWIGIGISVASLAILFIFIKPTDIIDAFRQANLFYLGIASFTIVIFLFLQGVRWRFLLNNEISFRELFHIQNIGYMLNMYLPARLGDFTRAVLVGSVPPVTIATGLSTMLVGRIIDMMFMVAILPFSLVAVPTLPEQLRAAALGTGVLALVAIIILILAANMRPLAGRIATAVFNRISFMDTQTWVRRIDDLLKGLDSLTRLKDGLILIGMTIIIWIPIIIGYWAGLKGVGIEATIPMAIFVMCAAAFSIAAPSSPGGIGVFHAGVTLALQVLGQPDGASAAFAFAYHFTNLLTLTVLGLIGLAATGATIRSVVNTTHDYLRRQKPKSPKS